MDLAIGRQSENEEKVLETVPLWNRSGASAFYRLQLSSCGEKECLTVTHAVRFADCFRFFVSFAQETVGTA